MASQDIVTRLITFFKFDLSDPIQSHQGYYVTRRSEDLLLTNPEWANEPDLHSLTGQLTNEMTPISGYLTLRLGTLQAPGTIGGPTEKGMSSNPDQTKEYVAAPTFHLDLNDVSITRIDGQDSSGKGVHARRSSMIADRRRRIPGIVWRAMAVHLNLRQGTTVDTVALDELVDRRLRAIERMAYQVSRRETLGINGISASPNTPTGPWTDQARVRPFEYPRIGTNETDQVVPAIGADNILPAGSADFSTNPGQNKPWLYETVNGRIIYNVPPRPGLQLPIGGVRENWTGPLVRASDDQPYELHLVPTGSFTAATAMDRIFQSKFDWWSRTWIYCDHVISAIEVEALLFALRRRNSKQPDPDSEFNSLAQNEYVQLLGHVGLITNPGGGAGGILMSDANDKYFENTEVQPSDLQIGDHIVFLNTLLHGVLVRDEWRLENALIMDIRSNKYQPDATVDKYKGGLIRSKLILQGHGIAPTPYTQYSRRLTKNLNKELDRIRAEIVANLAIDSTITSFLHNMAGATIIKWEPNEHFTSPSSWWLELKTTTNSLRWTSPAAIQKDIPRVVIAADATNVTQPFPPALVANGALFPIYEPKVDKKEGKNAWQSYLAGSTKQGNALVKVTATDELVPGMFIAPGGGPASKVNLVRPLVRPAL